MKKHNSSRGFGLFEILLVLAILAIIGGMAAPYGASYYERIKLNDERDALKRLGELGKQSFYSVDSTQNISFFSGASYTPAGSVLTAQTGSFAGVTGVALADTTWQAKFGRMMGLSFATGQVVSANSGEVSRAVVFNSTGRERWFLIGPTNEADKQRYMIVSFMINPEAGSEVGLSMPVNDGTALFFNEIWDNNWEVANATPPAGWSSRLSGTQMTAWNSEARGRTYAARVIVTRIVQRKCTVSIANTHTLDYAWLDIAGITNALVSAPNSGGVSTSPLVLEGRQAVLRRGTVAPGTTVTPPYPITAGYTHWIQ